MKKLPAALLVTAFIIQTVGCGQDANPSSDETGKTTESTGIITETTDISAPELPELDMNGKVFNIFLQGWCNFSPLDITDICVAEQNGEIINDTAFMRQLAVQEKYNCVISEFVDPIGQQDGIMKINSAVMSGENLYDIALIRSPNLNTLLSSGCLTDFTTIPYVNPESPYYVKASFDELNIDGSHYALSTNLSISPYMLIFATYFNKAMIADYNLENIYDTVRSGQWTIDKHYEMGKAVTADLNNDGIFDENDRYGTTHVWDAVEGFINSAGVKLTESRNGKLEQSYKSQISVDKMQHILEVMSDKETFFNVHTRIADSSKINRLETGMFMERQTLFSVAGLFYVPLFRDMKDDFGIAPMPKYDADQEDYISPIDATCFPITVVPRSNDELEYTGILLEEMSYRGYTELLPALYDTVLSGKCARDDDSVEMLDLIFSNTSYDCGMIFNFGGIRNEVRNMFQSFDGSFASTFASIDSKVDANIDELIKAINDNR